MISADEAREIAENSRNEQYRRDLKVIEELIRNSAEVGHSCAIYDGFINYELRKELEAAGYTVEKYPRITNDVYMLGYKISW